VDATDLLLVATRWLHGVAAVVWIGAVLFELYALRPALADELPASAEQALDAVTSEIIQTSLVVFLITGAILTFERLSHGAAEALYVWLLALKVLLAVAMYQVALRFRRAKGDRRIVGLRWVAGLGLVILFLAALLKSLYERALVT